MRKSDRISATRWTLLALLLALPMTVVCFSEPCTDEACSEGGLSDPASYEANFNCEGGNLAVTAGTASDVADLTDCFNGLEASASDVIDGVDAEVDFRVQHGGGNVTLTCAYQIGADLAEALTCAGDTLRPARFFFFSGSDPVHWRITALTTAVADGADTGFFAPHVFVACPGVAETEIELDGVAYSTPELPLEDTECGIRIEMNSAATAAGATFHSVTLTLSEFASCSNNADCPSGLRCRSGVCQDGSKGDACSSSHLPTGGGDCNAAAPFCVQAPGLSLSRCGDGSDGSGCAGSFHCAVDSTCIEYLPGLGLCQDGSATDLCLADADCNTGCDCLIPPGGSRGSCVGGCANPGESGAFCATALDCVPPLGCSNLGGQGICFACRQDAECGPGATCQNRQCVPGP